MFVLFSGAGPTWNSAWCRGVLPQVHLHVHLKHSHEDTRPAARSHGAGEQGAPHPHWPQPAGGEARALCAGEGQDRELSGALRGPASVPQLCTGSCLLWASALQGKVMGGVLVAQQRQRRPEPEPQGCPPHPTLS